MRTPDLTLSILNTVVFLPVGKHNRNSRHLPQFSCTCWADIGDSLREGRGGAEFLLLQLSHISAGLRVRVFGGGRVYRLGKIN